MPLVIIQCHLPSHLPDQTNSVSAAAAAPLGPKAVSAAPQVMFRVCGGGGEGGRKEDGKDGGTTGTAPLNKGQDQKGLNVFRGILPIRRQVPAHLPSRWLAGVGQGRGLGVGKYIQGESPCPQR